MRPIKFRAWDKREGLNRMWYLDGYIQYGDGWRGGNPDYKFYELHFGAGFAKVSASDTVIMQFTGLKDKNGKEIYEGDICQIHYYHDKTIPSPIGVVDWIDSGFSIRAVKNVDNTAITGIYSLRFKSGGHFGDTPAVEVIGNIYSNPELL